MEALRSIIWLDSEELEILERLKTVKDRVEYILENYPESRNDDFYLWLLYIRLFERQLSNYIKFIPYKLLKNAVKFETISRVRRKIQEEGRYLPTDPKVLEKRRRLAKIYQRVMYEV